MSKKTSFQQQKLKIPNLIILAGQFIAFISPKLITLLAAKLFTRPTKHSIPKREWQMDQNTEQKLINIPKINKQIITYQYGKSDKKILLIHGWSGRGTQLVKIADELLKYGYSTVSFDAPAHGKSPGKNSIMVDFIASIIEIDKQFGPFEAAIGHSLGGMSILNAIKQGVKVNQTVIIGSGDIVQDIIEDFISNIKLKPIIAQKLQTYFEKKYNEPMNSYSAYIAAKEIMIPVLVIHDEDDYEVPVKAGIHIHQYLKNGELFLTKGLGHRKILGDSKVIQKIINFITDKKQ